MPTSRKTPSDKYLTVEVASIAKPVGYWLDAQECALVIELADGQRLNIPLTAEQFEEKRNIEGVRVYDREKKRGGKG